LFLENQMDLEFDDFSALGTDPMEISIGIAR
jgi:hypothetical protein